MNNPPSPHHLVAVFMGGPSVEHPVSLNSGARVTDSLDRSRFRVLPVLIDQAGTFRIPPETAVSPPSPFDPASAFTNLEPLSAGQALTMLLERQVSLVFIALHGTYGEDGTVQGLLTAARIPFTGSGVIPSALAIDKIATKSVLRSAGLPVADDYVATDPDPSQMDHDLNEIERRLGLPCVVKSPRLGSSFGVVIAQSREEVKTALNHCRTVGATDRILVERQLTGRELTCGIIEDENGLPQALPVTEIRPQVAAWFDYRAKYTPGGSDEITPAPIPDHMTRRIQELALRCFHLLELQGLARVDFFATDDDVVIIEANTIPGLTETSLLPQQAQAAGIDFTRLLSLIALAGLGENKRRGPCPHPTGSGDLP